MNNTCDKIRELTTRCAVSKRRSQLKYTLKHKKLLVTQLKELISLLALFIRKLFKPEGQGPKRTLVGVIQPAHQL